MKKCAAIITAGLLLISIFGCGCGSGHAQQASLGKATDFELTDINGNPVKLSSYQGKVIILNFFATWCPPCRMEMPDFNELYRERQNEVVVIGINVGDESVPAIKNFVDRNKLLFPIAKDDGTVNQAYGPFRAIPVTVVIGKDFNIARQYIGARTKAVFENDIKALE
ncbi:MAG: TlpA disulfide reductase family protein [Candidatus Omnitrophica bacterium]|nr:TlpA disulfide reductase family protein [Candidatus Omnitrophota bacterium]